MAPVKDAPDFTSEALGGGKASLSDFRGKVIIVHFWASWCVPCREEFPALNALYGRLKEKGLVILAVAEDSHSRVDPFVKAHGAVFPVVVDRYGGVMKKYGIKVIPSSVIVDRSGKAAWIIIGPRDYGSPDAIEFFEKILE